MMINLASPTRTKLALCLIACLLVQGRAFAQGLGQEQAEEKMELQKMKTEVNDIKSKSTDGQPFWRAQTRPSHSSVVVAGTFGVRRPPTPIVNSAFGSSTPAETIPRGRWYLKLRPMRRILFAINAEASVSPA